MRFLRFFKNGRLGLAVNKGDHWLGLYADDTAFPGFPEDLLRRGDGALKDAAAPLEKGFRLEEGQFTYLPPLVNPPKIICVGLNYADHTKESRMEQPDYPTVFGRFPSSLTAHRAPIIRPGCSAQLDFEGEMAVVIGKGGRRIPRRNALDHVAGYSVFNDGSIRDYQFKTPQWTIGKNFDATGAFGPELVTADELPPGARGLTLTTRLNGAVVQRASTDGMIHDVEALIEILSEAMTLEPGDVIVSGTPQGVGFARTPPLWMKAGDVVEVDIEVIGLLRNQVAEERE